MGLKKAIKRNKQRFTYEFREWRTLDSRFKADGVKGYWVIAHSRHRDMTKFGRWAHFVKHENQHVQSS